MSFSQTYRFNGGVVSRMHWGASDSERYYISLAELKNFLIVPNGPITRRPGFEHIDVFGEEPAWLIPFRYSAATTFMLAFGDEVMRFYSNGAMVEDPAAPGDPLEVETPWEAAELSQLRHEQALDEVILVHPNHPPQRLFRNADDDWSFDEWELTYPPFMEANADLDVTVTPSATTGEIDLEASSPIWNANHVGAYWRIGHVRASNAEAYSIDDGTGQTAAMLISGVYTIRTTGTWTATVRLEASKDNTNWEVLKSWEGAGDMNIEHIGNIDEPLWIRANVSHYTDATSARVIIEADQSLVWGYVKIDSVNEAGDEAEATVLETLASTDATSYWAEGSWSDHNGYPSQVLLHDGRMFLAGTKREPLKYWGSVVDDWPNFRQIAWQPDYAIQARLYSKVGDRIRWMASRNGAIIIGTAGDDWIITDAADPDSAVARKATAYGSADVAMVELNDSLLFVQGRGQRVYDYVGIDVNDGLARDPYTANDLSRNAYQLTQGGVTQLAVSQHPDPTIWAVTDGKLAVALYDRGARILGWCEMDTEGEIASVATIPGEAGDEVWISVVRGDSCRIERLHPGTLDAALTGDQDGVLFVDAAKMVTLDEPGTTVDGLDHLEGETVCVLVDGAEHPDCVVEDGEIELDWEGTVVAVGLRFESLMETLPLVAQTQQGSTRYQIGRIHQAIVDQFNTFNLEYADSEKDVWRPVSTRMGTYTPNAAPPLQTGPEQLTVAGSYDRLPRLKFRQRSGMPACILSLAVNWNQTQS